jgi:hypothetical protein
MNGLGGELFAWRSPHPPLTVQNLAKIRLKSSQSNDPDSKFHRVPENLILIKSGHSHGCLLQTTTFYNCYNCVNMQLCKTIASGELYELHSLACITLVVL